MSRLNKKLCVLAGLGAEAPAGDSTESEAVEIMRTIYLIDLPGEHVGGIFLGDIHQFRDCFFSNAEDWMVREWAEEHGFVVETREWTRDQLDAFVHETVKGGTAHGRTLWA